MALNTTLLLIMRSFGAALLILVDARYFLFYVTADMALYLLLKVARSDFDYWLPIDGAAGIGVALLMKFTQKTVCDYTAVVQLRAPGELGGVYYTVNMLTALGATFASVLVYFRNEEVVLKRVAAERVDAGDDPQMAMEEGSAWSFVGWMSVSWMVCFGLFFFLMEAEYRKTFWSTQTGAQWTRAFFLEGETDNIRSLTLSHNKKQWTSISSDVEAWVKENWWRWRLEQPSWFTEAWISKVPMEWIPKEDKKMAEAKRNANKNRGRRSSVVPVMASDGVVPTMASSDGLGEGGRTGFAADIRNRPMRSKSGIGSFRV